MSAIRSKNKKVVYAILYYGFALVLLTIFLFPVIFMISKSFMTYADALDIPVRFFPTEIYWGNYSQMFDAEMIRWFFNTMTIIFFNAILGPLSASFCAYGFSRLYGKGKSIVFSVMMGTIMLPGNVIAIPMYVFFNELGWMDTYLPMIVPSILGGGALTIFLFIQFMNSYSKELDNAAKIDGANNFVIFWKIALPMCKIVFLAQAISVFIGTWNDYMTPLIYINDQKKYTLGLGIYYRYLKGTIGGIDFSASAKMAAGVVMTIPPAILFFIFQKQLIEGIQMGAIKG